jgi:hypothetical protein
MTQSQPVDINTRIEQYVLLRAVIKQKDDDHKKAMEPYRSALEALNSVLLNHLNTNGVDSAKGSAGTVYKTKKASATIADMDAFWTYCVGTGQFDLIDKKANVVAVADHIEQHKAPPPGVNYSTVEVVGVRKSA